VSEASPGAMSDQGGVRDQAGVRWSAADVLSVLRIPLAVAFVLVTHNGWRLAIVAAAAVTDLLDGPVARWRGSSRYGLVLDPIADKMFMAAAVGVVAFSGALEPYEIVGVLLRDIVATIAFAATFFSEEPRAIPARWSGKAVTVAQILTLVAFLLSSPYLRPIAWATTIAAVFSIVDYLLAAPRAQRRVGR
jgi:phosphatidylglycerophosphate synthase